MKKKKILCPTCDQDLELPPHEGNSDLDCPQCGQGLSKSQAKELDWPQDD